MPTSSVFEECDILLQNCIRESVTTLKKNNTDNNTSTSSSSSSSSSSFLRGLYSYYSNCRHFSASTLSRAKDLASLNKTDNATTTNPSALLEKSKNHFVAEFERDCSFILEDNIEKLNNNNNNNNNNFVSLPNATLPDSRGTVSCVLYKWKSVQCSRLFHRVLQRCLDESVQLMLPAPFHAAGCPFPSCRIAHEGTFVSVIVLPPIQDSEPVMTSRQGDHDNNSEKKKSSSSVGGDGGGCGMFALKTFAAALSPLQYPSTLSSSTSTTSSIAPSLLLPAISAYSCFGSNEFLMIPDKISALSQILDDPTKEGTRINSSPSFLLLRPELQHTVETFGNDENKISQLLDRASRKVAIRLIDHFNEKKQQQQQQHSSSASTKMDDASIINITLARNEISIIFHQHEGANIKLLYFVLCHLESLLATERPLDASSISMAKTAIGAEMIARSIKSMARDRMNTNNNNNNNNKQPIDVVQTIFNDFLTDKVFYRENVQPLMRKKFGCPDSFFVDRETLTPLFGGIAAIVARGLGFALERDMKTFVVASSSGSFSGDNTYEVGNSSALFSPKKLKKICTSGVAADLSFLSSLHSPAKENRESFYTSFLNNNASISSTENDNSTTTTSAVIFNSGAVLPSTTLNQLVSSSSPRNPPAVQKALAINNDNNNVINSSSNISSHLQPQLPPQVHNPQLIAVSLFLEAARILKFCFRQILRYHYSSQDYHGQNETISREQGLVSALSIVVNDLGQRIKRLGVGNSDTSFSVNNSTNSTNTSSSMMNRSHHQFSPSRFSNNNKNDNNDSTFIGTSSANTVLEQKSKQQQQRLRRTLSVWVLACASNVIVLSSSSSSSVSLLKNLVSEFVVIFRPTPTSTFESMSSLFCALTMMKRLSEDLAIDTDTTSTNSSNNHLSKKNRSELISSSIPELLSFVSRCGKTMMLTTNNNNNNNHVLYYPSSAHTLLGTSYELLLQEVDPSPSSISALSHDFFQCLETCSLILESVSSLSSGGGGGGIAARPSSSQTSSRATTPASSPSRYSERTAVVDVNDSLAMNHLSPSKRHLMMIQHQLLNGSDFINNNNNASSSSASSSALLVAPGLCSFLWNILLWNLRAGTELKKFDNENEKRYFTANDKNNTVLMSSSASSNSYISNQSRTISAADRAHMLPSPTGRNFTTESMLNNNNNSRSNTLFSTSPCGSTSSPTAFDESRFWAVGLDIVFFQPIFALKIPSLMVSSKTKTASPTHHHGNKNNNPNNNINNSNNNNNKWWQEYVLFTLTTTFPQLLHLPIGQIEMLKQQTAQENGTQAPSFIDELLTRTLIILVGVFSSGNFSHLDSELTTLAALLDPVAAKIFPALINSKNTDGNQTSFNNNNNNNNMNDISRIIDSSRKMKTNSNSNTPRTPRQRQQQQQQQMMMNNNNSSNNNNEVNSSSSSTTYNDPYRAILSESLKIILFTASHLPFETNAPKFSRFASPAHLCYRCTLDNSYHRQEVAGEDSDHHSSINNNNMSNNSGFVVGSPLRAIRSSQNQSSSSSVPSSSLPHHQQVRNLLVEYLPTLESSIPTSSDEEESTTNNNNNNNNPSLLMSEALYSLWSFWKKMTDRQQQIALIRQSKPFVFEIHKFKRNAEKVSQSVRNKVEEEVSNRMVIVAEEEFKRKKIEKELCALNEEVYREFEKEALSQERFYAALKIQRRLGGNHNSNNSSSSSRKREVLSEKRMQLQEKQRRLEEEVLIEEQEYAALKIQRRLSPLSSSEKGSLSEKRTQQEEKQRQLVQEVFSEEQAYAATRIQAIHRQKANRNKLDEIRSEREEQRRRNSNQDEFLIERQFAATKIQSVSRKNFAKKRTDDLRDLRRQQDRELYERDSPERINNNNKSHHHHHVGFRETQEQKETNNNHHNNNTVRGHYHGGSLALIKHDEKDEEVAADHANEVKEALHNHNQTNTHDSDEDCISNEEILFVTEEEVLEQEQLYSVLKLQSAHRQNAAKKKSSRMRSLKAHAVRQCQLLVAEENIDRDEIGRQEAGGAALLRRHNKLLLGMFEASNSKQQQKNDNQDHHHVKFRETEEQKQVDHDDQATAAAAVVRGHYHGGSLALIKHDEKDEEVAADHSNEVKEALQKKDTHLVEFQEPQKEEGNEEKETTHYQHHHHDHYHHGGALALIRHNTDQDHDAHVTDDPEANREALKHHHDNDDNDGNDEEENDHQQASAAAARRIQCAQRQKFARNSVKRIQSLKTSAIEEQKMFFNEWEIARREVLLDECSGFASKRMMMQVVTNVQSEADFEKSRVFEQDRAAQKELEQDILELVDLEEGMRKTIEDCERRMKRFMRLPK